MILLSKILLYVQFSIIFHYTYIKKFIKIHLRMHKKVVHLCCTYPISLMKSSGCISLDFGLVLSRKSSTNASCHVLFLRGVIYIRAPSSTSCIVLSIKQCNYVMLLHSRFLCLHWKLKLIILEYYKNPQVMFLDGAATSVILEFFHYCHFYYYYYDHGIYLRPFYQSLRGFENLVSTQTIFSYH